MTFNWTTQYKNAFKLLKAGLVKMPALQYPNQNKQFKLFTDASKHSYSGILHKEKTSDMPGTKASLIPIAYFSGSFCRTQQLWNTTQYECYVVYQSVQKFVFILHAQNVCYNVIISHWLWIYNNLTLSFSTYKERRM